MPTTVCWPVKKVHPVMYKSDRGMHTEKGNNSTKNLRYMLKSQSVHLHFSLNLYANYKDLRLCGSSDILLTSLFQFKMPMSEKGE